MATDCFVPIRVPGIRATKLNSCGAVDDTTNCNMVTTSGIITITIEKEVVDRQGDPQLNANGEICDDTTKPEQRRWYNVTVEFCRVDPQLINLMTAEPLVLDDAASPNVVGFRTRRGSVNLSAFALEWWTGLGGDTFCTGGIQKYGYALMPFLTEGVMTIPTFQNDRANFTVTARTDFNSLWGQGPYNVLVNQTGPNATLPGPLISAITADDDFHIQTTTLPPPLFNTCGCQDATPVVEVAPTNGAAPLNVTLTFPLDGAGVPMLPATITWETGVSEVVTSGTNVVHNYPVAGTKNITYRPTTHSAPTFTATVTVT